MLGSVQKVCVTLLICQFKLKQKKFSQLLNFFVKWSEKEGERERERDGWEEREMTAFRLLSDLCQFGWITEFGKVQVSQEKRTD